MAIDLSPIRGDSGNQAEEIGFIKTARYVEAIDAIGYGNPGSLEAPDRAAAQRMEDRRPEPLRPRTSSVELGSQARLLVGETNDGDVKLARKTRESLNDDRMDMQMQMAVDLRKLQTGASEPLELGPNLPAQLVACFGTKLEDQPSQCRIRVQAVLPIQQQWNLGGERRCTPGREN
jgi:hypothetical protein